MAEKMLSDESQIKSRARSLLLRIHPDRLDPVSTEAGALGAKLIPLMEKILKRPEDMEHWGDDINNEYSAIGSKVVITGLGKQGELREPREIELRKPKDFLDIIEAYLDTGSIPPKLLETPLYNPQAVDDEYEMHFTPASPEVEANDTAKALKDAIATIEDYDHGYAIYVATTISPKHNMRITGVLSALDAKLEEVIRKEIETAKTPEDRQVAEEHVASFPFEDKEIAERLRTVLATSAAPEAETPDSDSSSVRELLEQITDSRTLEALTDIASTMESREFPSELDRKAAIKSIEHIAKRLVTKECNANDSIEKFAVTAERVRNFPFPEVSYGFEMLEFVEMRVKYLAFGKISQIKTIQEINALSEEITAFPFRNKENLEYLKVQLENHQRSNRIYS